jgi:hypothetical protein
VTGRREEGLDEAWQQPEAFNDHTRFSWEAQQIFDDQVEALAPKPVEGLQHGLRGSVRPTLVHVHCRELGQLWTVVGCAAPGVIGHHIVGRIDMQTVPSGYAACDGRLACSGPAADPVDVLQPDLQRCGVVGLGVMFRSRWGRVVHSGSSCARWLMSAA